MPSIADLEYAYLGNQGATGTLADRRSQIYGDQFAYFSARSGLTPVNLYSLIDHKYAYYAGAATAWTEKRRNRALIPNATAGWIALWGNGGAGTSGLDGALYKNTWTTASTGGNARISTAQAIPVTPQEQLYMSMDAAATDSWHVYLMVDFRDAGNSYVSLVQGTPTAPGGTPSTPTRLGFNFQVPNGIASVVPFLASGTGAVPVNTWIAGGRLLVESGSSLSFFSGDTAAASALEQYRWLGAPNASPSVYETRLSSTPSSGSLDDVMVRFWSLSLGL